MAKKYVYSQGAHGVSDFIYVDLLPDVKRVGQFNIKVIIGLLLFITLTFVLVFIPYSNQVATYEDLNALNNDLNVELTLTQEEFIGYGINIKNANFESDINLLDEIKVDIRDTLGDIDIEAKRNDTFVEYVSYNAQTSEFVIEFSSKDYVNFGPLETDLLTLDWVKYCTKTTWSVSTDGQTYVSTYTIGVDYFVK